MLKKLRDKDSKGFTLIELLVVISIIALLLSILLPSLRKVKDQAKAVICKSNLRQWGVCFEMYTNQNNGKFMPGIDENWSTGQYSWIVALKPYHNTPEIRLCPNAKRTEAEGGKKPKAAWNMTPEINAGQFSELRDSEYDTGSYAVNWWVNSSTKRGSGAMYDTNLKWKTAAQSNKSSIPVLMDGGFILARPRAIEAPPEYDGKFAWAEGGRGMSRVCTDRHSGHINILYMDWSANKVGLKDLWNQKWHKNYEPPAEEWDWPEWIQNL